MHCGVSVSELYAVGVYLVLAGAHKLGMVGASNNYVVVHSTLSILEVSKGSPDCCVSSA